MQREYILCRRLSHFSLVRSASDLRILSSMRISYLGPAEVAAWGYLGYVWSMFEYFSDGIADASEVRCSYHLGANNPQLARLASYKSIYLGVLASLFATSVIFLLSNYKKVYAQSLKR